MDRAHPSLWLVACSIALLTACARDAQPPPTPAAPPPAPAAAIAPPSIDPAILAAPTRPADDAKDDAARKPVELLTFARVAPGNTVLDMEAGAGYFTELLSSIVGPSGKVHMQNPSGFRKFVGKEIDARLANNRLANVSVLEGYFDSIALPDASVDVVLWALGPHDLYYKPEGETRTLGDPAKSYAEMHRVLKSGGYFVVLDHAAEAGAPTSTGGTIHRIDPAHVKASAAAAGFRIDEESSLLANPADDHKKLVFDPAVRRKTDQFLIRFVK